ncbi:MAG: hypothetical protein GY820_10960, partial [Gammaproteobacteria bacterium]|nr:hypothetical protein [Gammaproteobacteria bacterium]
MLEFWSDEQIKIHQHTSVLPELEKRVPVALNSPKMKIEGEEVVLDFEAEALELKKLEAVCGQPSDRVSQSIALVEKLHSKVFARYCATQAEEHDDACKTILKLGRVIFEMNEDSIALFGAGKIPDENTQREHEMKFHGLCRLLARFMEVYGVDTPKMNIEGVRENSVNSSHSAVHSMCDDQAVSSLNTPSSIEIDAESQTCSSQTLMGSETQLEENLVNSSCSAVPSMHDDNATVSPSASSSIEVGAGTTRPLPQHRYYQASPQNWRAYSDGDRGQPNVHNRPRPTPWLKGKGSSKYQGCFVCFSQHHLAKNCFFRQQRPGYGPHQRVPQSPQDAGKFGLMLNVSQTQSSRSEEIMQPNEKMDDFLRKIADAHVDMGRAIAAMQSEIQGISPIMQSD